MKINKKEKFHLVSFSGGKDSTAMLLLMMELGMKIDMVLYCDTWMEFPAMYRHVEKIKNVVEEAGIQFVTLKSTESFKYMMLEHPVKRQKPIFGNPKGYSWADSRSRWCTSKLKLALLSKFKNELQSKYDVVEYVGIAADEQYRLEREVNKNHVHPLVYWGWDEAKALQYCYDKGYDWEGIYKIFDRVSCWCCPLQSLKDLKGLWKNFPELWNELKEMDKQTWRQFRADYSVEELELRFKFESKREDEGLTINPKTKEFRQELKLLLDEFRKGKINLETY